MGGKHKLNSFEELGTIVTHNPEQGTVSDTSTIPNQGKNAVQNPPKAIPETPEDEFLAIKKEKKGGKSRNTEKRESQTKETGNSIQNTEKNQQRNQPRTSSAVRYNRKKPLSAAHAGLEGSFDGLDANGNFIATSSKKGGYMNPVKVISVEDNDVHSDFFASNLNKENRTKIEKGFAKIPTNERALTQRKSRKTPEPSSPYIESKEAKEYFKNSQSKKDASIKKKVNKLVSTVFPQISESEIEKLDNDHSIKIKQQLEKGSLKKAREIVEKIDQGSIQKPTPATERKLIWPTSRTITDKKFTRETPTNEKRFPYTPEKPEVITNKKNIADFLFKKLTGKETFAVHGAQEKDGAIRPQTDLDGKLSVFLADYFGIKWNNTQFIGPGETPRDASVVFDSGYKKGATIEIGGRSFQIFFDHHAKEKTDPTSASNEFLKTVEHVKNHKEIPEWIKRFVYFTTEIDNFSYFDRKDRTGKKIFTADYASKEWPETLYALYRYLPFSFIKERFEKGVSPLTPFTKEEREISVRTPQGGTATIEELIERMRKSTKYSINIVKKTSKKMFDSYILDEHKTLGKLLFVETTTDEKGKVSGQVQIKEVANMLGYDTLIHFSKETGNIYISSQKDLNSIQENLKEIGKLKGPIRGQQTFGKTEISKEEIVKLLEIDDSPEKRIGRYIEEKRKLEEELRNMDNS